MGDELRSTNVAPKTIYNGANLTSRSDTPYSLEALEHLEAEGLVALIKKLGCKTRVKLLTPRAQLNGK